MSEFRIIESDVTIDWIAPLLNLTALSELVLKLSDNYTLMLFLTDKDGSVGYVAQVFNPHQGIAIELTEPARNPLKAIQQAQKFLGLEVSQTN